MSDNDTQERRSGSCEGASAVFCGMAVVGLIYGTLAFWLIFLPVVGLLYLMGWLA